MPLDAADPAVFLDASGHPLLRFRLGSNGMGDLVIGSSGWSAWRYRSLDIRVRIEQLGRFQVTGLALLSNRDSLFGRTAITVTELRDVPLVRLDAVLNDPRLEQALPAAFDYAREHGQDLSPTGGVERDQIELGDAVPPPGRNYSIAGAKSARGRPDAFYRAVAHAWSTAIAEGHRNPATVIANANDVSVTAVHRWVREARRRKVMAPSSRDGDSGS